MNREVRGKMGILESFNGKLRDEAVEWRIYLNSILEAKVLTEQWRDHYNNVRPHSSLNFLPPVPEVILPLQVANV